MGQCCAGEKRQDEPDNQAERRLETDRDTNNSDMDSENERDEYTERDPLLSDKSPAINYSQSAELPLYANEPRSPVRHDQLQKESDSGGDYNQQSAKVPVSPPVHHDNDGNPDTSTNLTYRDPHAVIQPEPHPPGQHEKHQPLQREQPVHSRELPYELYHGAQEKEPHYPIQEESPATPVDSCKYEFDDQALQLAPVLPQHYNTLQHKHGDSKHEREPLMPSISKNTPLAVPKCIEEETMAYEIPSSLRKAEFKSNTSGSYDHSGGRLTSRDGDLKLIIPEGAIKDGDLVTLYIATDLYDSFKLPSHCHLASPYYWISATGSYRFYKPVQVEFEHFAVVTACDPSHYQLLTCEDDDESHTMRPVDYDLDFRVQGNISLCTFYTYHFCSHCLCHNCKDPIINKIGAFFLKQKNFQTLDEFTVEIWFSFPISYCMKRNEELYTEKGMVLHSDSTTVFEASSDKSSKSYFSLSYKQRIHGWCVNYFRFKEIPTEQVNFYNHFTSMKELQAHEEQSLFPPRFILKVTKKCQYNTELNTYIMVTLCKTKEKKSTEFFFMFQYPQLQSILPLAYQKKKTSHIQFLPIIVMKTNP